MVKKEHEKVRKILKQKNIKELKSIAPKLFDYVMTLGPGEPKSFEVIEQFGHLLEYYRGPRESRFKMLSSFTAQLISAEEQYLLAGGWKEKKGLWWTSEYTIGFARNTAVLMAKANDHNREVRFPP